MLDIVKKTIAVTRLNMATRKRVLQGPNATSSDLMMPRRKTVSSASSSHELAQPRTSGDVTSDIGLTSPFEIGWLRKKTSNS